MNRCDTWLPMLAAFSQDTWIVVASFVVVCVAANTVFVYSWIKKARSIKTPSSHSEESGVRSEKAKITR